MQDLRVERFECERCHDQGCGMCLDLVALDRAEEDGATGDARRCPVHPSMKTSSDDGMFDAPCPACEYEMAGEHDYAAYWSDPFREVCVPLGAWFGPIGRDSCASYVPEDEIPF